jgi:hypothetical protein
LKPNLIASDSFCTQKSTQKTKKKNTQKEPDKSCLSAVAFLANAKVVPSLTPPPSCKDVIVWLDLRKIFFQKKKIVQSKSHLCPRWCVHIKQSSQKSSLHALQKTAAGASSHLFERGDQNHNKVIHNKDTS